MESLYQNEELKDLFNEEITRLFIEEEKGTDETERGFYEGMTLSVYSRGCCGKIADVSPKALVMSA